MAKKKKQTNTPDKGLLEFDGEIIDVLPNQMFKVQLENGHTIIAYTGGNMRQFIISIVYGDKVKVEMSQYDLSKGIITYRN